MTTLIYIAPFSSVNNTHTPLQLLIIYFITKYIIYFFTYSVNTLLLKFICKKKEAHESTLLIFTKCTLMHLFEYVIIYPN